MRRTLTSSLFVLLAACSVAPKYERPAVELPQAWKETSARFAEDGRWWRVYNDDSLNKLIDEGLAGNSDLLIAAARIDEARGILAEIQGQYYPTIDARGNASRQKISERTATFFPGVPQQYSDYRANLNVSYDLDLFGRIRSSADAAREELAGNEASRDAIRLALAAQIAKSYFALRSFDEQVDLTRKTVALREEALALQRKRFQGGIISEFDLRQLEAETAAVRAQLPPLEREREREEAALGVLLGRTPKLIFEGGVTRTLAYDEMPGPAAVPAGIPSELLLRRPDLVEAEHRLMAANARIGVARADMFPSISLTGNYGVASSQLSNLFSAPAIAWQLAAGVTQPIFAGGRLRARTDQAEARERALVAQYQKTIQTAFSEVRTALAVQARSRESFDAESARAAALAETLRLARLRYQNGVASQLDVIDAERGLLAARIARIEALRAQRAAVADLFRALGG
ncbi:MAG TPA: efflux transporter outer membrane subunit [Burkholderiales bacterium]|nr:efflux transporter outer membrane subunit [Burkholderiales bacterium]